MSGKKPKSPGKNGYRYQPQWGLIIVCEGEDHQARLFDALKAFGLKCRVVAV